jgi:histidinol phosphatase-like PHP family hydrolase
VDYIVKIMRCEQTNVLGYYGIIKMQKINLRIFYTVNKKRIATVFKGIVSQEGVLMIPVSRRDICVEPKEGFNFLKCSFLF